MNRPGQNFKAQTNLFEQEPKAETVKMVEELKRENPEQPGIIDFLKEKQEAPSKGIEQLKNSNKEYQQFKQDFNAGKIKPPIIKKEEKLEEQQKTTATAGIIPTENASGTAIYQANYIKGQLLSLINGTAEITAVTKPEQAETVNELTRSVKTLYNEAENTRKKLVSPLNNEVSAINKTFKAVTDELLRVEAGFKKVLSEYHNREQQRIAEERRIREKEQQRIAQLAYEKEQEALREQREAQKKLEEQQRQAEQAAAAGNRVEAEKAKKLAAEQAQQAAVAAENQRKASAAAAAQIKSLTAEPFETQPKMTGSSFVTEYIPEIINIKDFLKYCLDTGNYQYIKIDEGLLKRNIAALKGNADIPGVKITEKTTMRTRSRG